MPSSRKRRQLCRDACSGAVPWCEGAERVAICALRACPYRVHSRARRSGRHLELKSGQGEAVVAWKSRKFSLVAPAVVWQFFFGLACLDALTVQVGPAACAALFFSSYLIRGPCAGSNSQRQPSIAPEGAG